MGDANREQIEFWKRLGQRWVAWQETLDRVWGPFGEAALERAAVRPGERVIDVGCGCGATALALAARVGPSGSVLGIDVSAAMLSRARQRAQVAGVTHLELIEADASTHVFAGDADLVFSRFGLMFFRDSVTAFANLRRALRPSGRLVFVCLRARELNPLWTVPLAAVATVTPVEPPTPPGQPGPFALADEHHLRAVLDGAGFVAAVCEPVEYDLAIGDDLDSATDFVTNAGSAAGALATAGDEQRVQARAAVRQALAQCRGPSGVSLPAAAWIVRAARAS